MVADDASIPAFRQAMAEAVRSLEEDGRVSAAAAARVRRSVAPTSAAARSRLEDRPEALLGPFEDLPAASREALVETIAEEDRHRLRGHELGAWHAAALRGLWRLKEGVHRRFSGDSAGVRLLREAMDVLAFGARRAPADALWALRRRRLAREGARGSRPSLRALLEHAGISPAALAVCYARGVPQPPAFRAFWRDSERHVAVGTILGIDLLPSPDGFWYMESNLDPAQRPERAVLYDRDPFVLNLLAFARESGFERLMVLDNNSSGVEPITAARYEEEAARIGLELILVDRVNVPGSPYRQSFGIPRLDGRDTLVAVLRAYPTAVHHVLGGKRSTLRALRLYREATGAGEPRVPAGGRRPVLGGAEEEEPFPTVVYKMPDLDQGRGVYFLKVRSPEEAVRLAREAVRSASPRNLQERVLHALVRDEGFYQAYIRPTMLPGRRLYIVRAHVLVSPAGLRLLSAHRVISGRPVPESVPDGVIADPTPYLVNFSAGSRYEVVPPDEEEAVERASLAVGEGLAWAVRHGFECE